MVHTSLPLQWQHLIKTVLTLSLQDAPASSLKYAPCSPAPLRLSSLPVLPKAQMPTAAPKPPPQASCAREPTNIWSTGPIPTSPPHCHISWPDGLTPTPLEQLPPRLTVPCNYLLLKAARARVPAPCASALRGDNSPSAPPLHLPCGPAPGAPPQPLLAAAARASLQPVPATSPAPTPSRCAQPDRLPASAGSRASPAGAGGGGRYL